MQNVESDRLFNLDKQLSFGVWREGKSSLNRSSSWVQIPGGLFMVLFLFEVEGLKNSESGHFGESLAHIILPGK